MDTQLSFYVHTEKGWLGASPDAHVFDPDTSTASGMNSNSHFQRQTFVLKRHVKIPYSNW